MAERFVILISENLIPQNSTQNYTPEFDTPEFDFM